MPPAGYRARQVVTLSDDCTVHEGPVELVPLSSDQSTPGGTETRQLPSVSKNWEKRSGGIQPLATFTNQMHTASEIWDCCN
jgi:hypothetical protein